MHPRTSRERRRDAPAGWERASGPGGRVARRIVLILLVVAAGLGIGALGRVAELTGSPGRFNVEVAPRDDTGPGRFPPEPARPAMAVPSGRGPGLGTWDMLPEAPIAARTGHVGVWAGDSAGEGVLVLWGGWDADGPFADGALLAPRTGTWEPVAPAPLSRRGQTAAVWTGAEVVVWGGRDEHGPLSDGARYDPSTDTWRRMAAAPISARHSAGAVWTGAEVLIWGGEDERRLADGARYDPATDTWRPMSPSPLTSTGGRPPRLVWLDGEAVVWAPPRLGSTDPTAALYDPSTDAWTVLDPPEGLRRFDPNLLWTGRYLVAWGPEAAGSARVAAATWDAESGIWQQTVTPPVRWRPAALLAAVSTETHDKLLAWGGDTPINGGLRHPVEGWQPLATMPVLGRIGHTAVWTGRDLVVWGGQRNRRALGDGAVWSPGWVPAPAVHASATTTTVRLPRELASPDEAPSPPGVRVRMR